MAFDPLVPPLLLTCHLPGIGGRIKQHPEDFIVEEIPAYAASGQGEFLYLWVEKRAMGAEYFVRQVAKRLGLTPGEVGTAGLKDRQAITRQWVSVPIRAERLLSQLDGDGIRLLEIKRHSNKLRAGHLRGNRFRILVRDVSADAASRVPVLVERISQLGLPNYYGPQRFGRDGETVHLGFALLRNERHRTKNPFLRKLALSAAQAALFNCYLRRRLEDGLLHSVLNGDVMAKWPQGAIFLTRNPPEEQTRFDRRELVHTGPIFGRKMYAPTAVAAEREAAVLKSAELSLDAFASFGKLLQGTRRQNLIYVDDLQAVMEAEGVRLQFTLPAGSYATVLLAEILKTTNLDADEAVP